MDENKVKVTSCNIPTLQETKIEKVKKETTYEAVLNRNVFGNQFYALKASVPGRLPKPLSGLYTSAMEANKAANAYVASVNG